MTATTFGERLALARRVAGYRSQQALADKIGVSSRTIRNYERGSTQPDAATLEQLREVLGQFDAQGDAVEVAVRQSELVKWRQDAVISEYEKHRYEQGREVAG